MRIVSPDRRSISLLPLNWREGRITHFLKKNYLLFLTISFFFILAFFFISWPVVAYDTDIWYHLSGGRYFFENHQIADNSYFSFLSPAKNWYNYYWLFQIITFTIFSYADYYALIILRCLLFLATAYLIYLQLVQEEEDDFKLLLALAFFVGSTLAFTTRELLVRPHLFTYLFIALFLYLLEKKKKLLWLLPLLGIFWNNIHGIEYPVMLLILFAYLAEFFWQGRKSQEERSGGKYVNWQLIMTCYTIFLTPGFIKLLPTPFEAQFGSGRFQFLYIDEHKLLPWEKIFTFSLFPFSNILGFIQNTLIISFFAIFLVSLCRRKLRISHAVLFAGAVYLLFQHTRFCFEFFLLSLPMARQFIQFSSGFKPSKKAFFIILSLLMIIVPLLAYASSFRFRPHYPLSSAVLPTGVVAFLNHVNVGGKLMNDPNSGGYLHWSLHKNYKIAMDLQMSIFSDNDFAQVSNAFCNENAFQDFIRQYDPSFITVSLMYQSRFVNFIANHGQFVPVFLDKDAILYVNGEHYPILAEGYRIKTIDPYRIRDLDIEKMDEEKKGLVYNEASRILQIDKTNPVANWLVGNLKILPRNYEGALRHAEIVINNQPDLSVGYIMKADVMRELGHHAEASYLYQMAVERGSAPDIKTLYRNLFIVYNKLGEYKKAYKLYFQVANPFSVNSSYQDIYELSLSAAATGKIKDAIVFLKIAALKVPREDIEYRKKIDDMLAYLSSK